MHPKSISVAVVLLLSSLSFPCEGFGISHPQILSQIGQPMRVRARVDLDGRESDKVRVSLLPAAAYASVGFGPAQVDPSRLRMRMEIDQQGTFLLIESDERVLEPVVNVAIVLQADGMRQSSLVSFMFDLPTTPHFAVAPEPEAAVAASGPDVALAARSRPPAMAQATPVRATPRAVAAPRIASRMPSARRSPESLPDAAAEAASSVPEAAAASWRFAGRTIELLTGEGMQRRGGVLLILLCGGTAFLLLLRNLNARMSLEDFDTWEGPHPAMTALPGASRLALPAPQPVNRQALPAPAGDPRARFLLKRVSHLEPQLVGEDSLFRRLLLVRAEIEAGHLADAEAQLQLLEKEV